MIKRTTPKQSASPDGDSAAKADISLTTSPASDVESDQWDGSDGDWEAEYQYIQLAQAHRGARAKAAIPCLNDILTYDMHEPQYACELAKDSKITMDWALEELKRRRAQKEPVNSQSTAPNGNNA
jgi:hypothetical protein